MTRDEIAQTVAEIGNRMAGLAARLLADPEQQLTTTEKQLIRLALYRRLYDVIQSSAYDVEQGYEIPVDALKNLSNLAFQLTKKL